MLRSPNEQLEKNGRKINPFARQPVVHPASIQLFGLGGNDSAGEELPEAVGQDVRRNPLTRLLKLPERPESANHEIANDEQGPTVPEDL